MFHINRNKSSTQTMVNKKVIVNTGIYGEKTNATLRTIPGNNLQLSRRHTCIDLVN